MDRQENQEKRKRKKWLLLLLLLLLLFIITVVITITYLKGDKDAEATGGDVISTEQNNSANEDMSEEQQNDTDTEENTIEEDDNTDANIENNNDNENNQNRNNGANNDNSNNTNDGNNSNNNGNNTNNGNNSNEGTENNGNDNNNGNDGNDTNNGNNSNEGTENNENDNENNKEPEDDKQTYIVTFEDYDGKVLKTQTVEEEKDATAPANPTREGYKFTGWDKEFANIKSDITVTAEYKINKYTVTFKDHDGTVLKTQTVEYGKDATAPANPTREGYTFIGWDKEFTNIKTNITVTALYEEIKLELKKDGIITIERIKDNYEFNATSKDKITFHFNIGLSNIIKDSSVVKKYTVELYKGSERISSTSETTSSSNVTLSLPQIEKTENTPALPEGERYTFKIIVESKSGEILKVQDINIRLNVILAGTLGGSTVRFQTEETDWYTGFFLGETKAQLKIN